MPPIPAFSDDARRHRHAPTHGQVRLTATIGAQVLDAARHDAVLWLVLRGQVEVRAREGEFRLGARDWIALQRESAPLAMSGGDALLLGIGIGIGSADGLQAGGVMAGRGRMAHGMRSRALRLWHALGVLASTDGYAVDADGALVVSEFVAALQAELIDGIERCPGHSGRRKLQILQRMQRARLCLEGQAGDGLRIGELARRINFSPWYFSKVFHAVYGEGPLQFVARMRLEQASRLLKTTRMPVTEVSAACGFDSPCSFARAFRARFGMTASEHRLRNAHHKGDPRRIKPSGDWRKSMPQYVRGVR